VNPWTHIAARLTVVALYQLRLIHPYTRESIRG
jgi:hypothetical protein